MYGEINYPRVPYRRPSGRRRPDESLSLSAQFSWTLDIPLSARQILISFDGDWLESEVKRAGFLLIVSTLSGSLVTCRFTLAASNKRFGCMVS